MELARDCVNKFYTNNNKSWVLAHFLFLQKKKKKIYRSYVLFLFLFYLVLNSFRYQSNRVIERALLLLHYQLRNNTCHTRCHHTRHAATSTDHPHAHSIANLHIYLWRTCIPVPLQLSQTKSVQWINNKTTKIRIITSIII